MNASAQSPSGTPSRARPQPFRFACHLLRFSLVGLLLPALSARADTAPTLTTPPLSLTVTAGQNASFSVVAAGTAPLSYQWYKDNTALSGATAATYTITGVQATDAGTFTVKVSNAAGSVRSFVPFTSHFAGGASHTLMVKDDGTLWATGSNGKGQLGDGTTTDRLTPVQVATGVTAVAAGNAHSLFLKSDGTLWAMGANGSGQLGDGTTTDRNIPVQITTGVTAIAATRVESWRGVVIW